MKSQTLIGYSTFASSRTSDPATGRLRFIWLTRTSVGGSVVEEAERLGVGCEFVECVAASLEIGTQIGECVAT